jgi:hypothetical protein
MTPPGIEPGTLVLKPQRANQLSHGRLVWKKVFGIVFIDLWADLCIQAMCSYSGCIQAVGNMVIIWMRTHSLYN